MLNKYKSLSLFQKMLFGLAFVILVYMGLVALMHAGVINRYYQGILISVCINIILVVSLNVTTGFLGQLTLGHAGFMAVGAYASAILTTSILPFKGEIAFLLSLLFGGIISMGIGAIVCIPTLRLKGDYLAIITLAFGEVIKNILLNMEITGGPSGLVGIKTYTNFFWVYVIMVLCVLLTLSLIHSTYGRQITSLRDNEIAAMSSGISINKVKMLAFVFAAFFAGVAGGLYAHYIGILEPKLFDFNKSIEILVMVVLGGMGSIKGSIAAAIALTLLPETLRGMDNLRMLIYALALIVIMLVKHNDKIMSFFASKFHKGEKAL